MSLVRVWSNPRDKMEPNITSSTIVTKIQPRLNLELRKKPKICPQWWATGCVFWFFLWIWLCDKNILLYELKLSLRRQDGNKSCYSITSPIPCWNNPFCDNLWGQHGTCHNRQHNTHNIGRPYWHHETTLRTFRLTEVEKQSLHPLTLKCFFR